MPGTVGITVPWLLAKAQISRPIEYSSGTAAQMTGFGAVLAFEVADAPTADRLCDAVYVIVHATSLDAVESTIERRSKLPGQCRCPALPPGPCQVTSNGCPPPRPRPARARRC